MVGEIVLGRVLWMDQGRKKLVDEIFADREKKKLVLGWNGCQTFVLLWLISQSVPLIRSSQLRSRRRAALQGWGGRPVPPVRHRGAVGRPA